MAGLLNKHISMVHVIIRLRKAGVRKEDRHMVFDRTVPDAELPDIPIIREARSYVRAIRSAHG